MKAHGPFDVTLTPQAPDNLAAGISVGRLSIAKQFSGDLEATSTRQMLIIKAGVDGSAGSVAREQVTGTLHGRSGTFALLHSGTMTHGTPQLSITVVPDSGTGQLAGLAGIMTVEITDGQHLNLPRSGGDPSAWCCQHLSRTKGVITMAKTHAPYPQDFREDAVRLVRARTRPLPEIARELEIGVEIRRSWVKRAERDARVRHDGLATPEREEIRRLRREVRDLREEREILKKAAAFFAMEHSRRCGMSFITREKAVHSVARLCRVSQSGYYAWCHRGVAARTRQDAQLQQTITALHRRSRGTYGVPRIHADLHASGIRCGRKRVAHLMRVAHRVGVHRRRSLGTTQRGPESPALPDRVGRVFAAAAPNRLWTADSTAIPTQQGWLYLAVVLDDYSRRIVGWAMATHLRTTLVLHALEMAIRTRRPAPGLIHHGDHGSQDTALT